MASLLVVLSFSAALVTLAVLWFLFLNRGPKDASSVEAEILEELEAKARGSFAFRLTESLMEPVRETRRLVSDFNPRSIVIFLRDVQVHLKPHWFCSQCGRQVRRSFWPMVDSYLDPIGDEDVWLAWARVTCLRCKPILGSIEEVDA